MQKAKRRNKAKGSRRPVWLACLFLLVGLGLTIGAVVSFGNTITFVRSAQRASGKVMELERTSCGSKDRSTCYAPRVVFTDLKTGHEVEFVSSTASNPPGFRVGEQVAVLYDPEDPVTALIPGFFSIWGLVSILSGIGIFFVAAGGGLLLAPGKFIQGSTAPTFTCTSSGEDSESAESSTPSDFGDAHSADFAISNADADFSSV